MTKPHQRSLQRLTGRVAFVTGGARGQGRAHAAKFASEGADVVICDVPSGAVTTTEYPVATADDLELTADLVRSAGRRCIAEQVDVRDQQGLNSIVARAVETFGRLDVLVANAGIATYAAADEMDESVWQEMIDINLTGIWKSVRSVIPQMKSQTSGSVIVTASVNAQEAFPDMTHYVAAKHGALGLMRAFALELAPHGIRVNALSPGVVGSPMADNEATRRMIFGQSGATFADYLRATHNWAALRNTSSLPPWAIADAAIWLASEESRYVTGLDVVVDGGHLLLPGYNHQPAIDEHNPIVDYHDTALGPVYERSPPTDVRGV